MLVLVLAAVAGAVGWGMLITALAKTPGQVGTIGSAVMLIFGILGGPSSASSNMPAWFQRAQQDHAQRLGPGGFTTLALGGGLARYPRCRSLALLGHGRAALCDRGRSCSTAAASSSS